MYILFYPADIVSFNPSKQLSCFLIGCQLYAKRLHLCYRNLNSISCRMLFEFSKQYKMILDAINEVLCSYQQFFQYKVDSYCSRHAWPWKYIYVNQRCAMDYNYAEILPRVLETYKHFILLLPCFGFRPIPIRMHLLCIVVHKQQ